jgi:predicted phage terminase large subunit-like protein
MGKGFEEAINSLSLESLEGLSLEDLRQERVKREREYYQSAAGFVDFVRDSGAAPDAVYEPHGKHAQSLITWSGTPDPDLPTRTLYKWKLALWPRGSFKSQVFNVGQVAWLIACDPNVRILVCSETNRQAKAFVQETMKIIDSEWFKERFGVHRGKEWKIGAGEFTSALRTRKGIKDPTLRAAGVGEVQTGSHWDFVLMDDICSQENTKTTASIEGLWQWFGETMAQLDPGCRLFMIGTLHHFADIYCRIMKDERIRAKFEISKHGWCEPLQTPYDPLVEGAKVFFPGRLTRQYVSDQKDIMTPRLFACFYENRPTTDEEQIFRPEYFNVIPDHNIPSGVWTYIFTDFAFTAEEKKNNRSDRTVFWVVSIDANRVAYVQDVVVGRWKPSDSCRMLCKLWDYYQRWNVKAVIIEKTAHQEVLSNLLEEIRRDTMIRPKLVEITGRNQEIKDMRIEACEPRFRNQNIYFVQSFRDQKLKWKTMFDEMIEWPFSDHDDIPDAISDIDKRNKEGRLYCPGPPPGWHSNTAAVRHIPDMLNGRFNPDSGWDPRQKTKEIDRGQDLWKSTNKCRDPLGGEQPSRNDNFFGKRMQPPKW